MLDVDLYNLYFTFMLFLSLFAYVKISISICLYVQWSLSVTDTLGPDIFGHFLLQYRGFPLSEGKNVLVTPVMTKIFVLNKEMIFLSIWRVC